MDDHNSFFTIYFEGVIYIGSRFWLIFLREESESVRTTHSMRIPLLFLKHFITTSLPEWVRHNNESKIQWGYNHFNDQGLKKPTEGRG